MPHYIDKLKKIIINWSVIKAICIERSPCKNMLDTYPNLQAIKIALKNMKFGNTNGYDAILSVLCGGYNPGKDWLTLKALFDQQLSTEKEQKIFLVRTIHILWMEKNGGLSWSIKDYSQNEINSLFYARRVNNYDFPSLAPDIPILSQDIDFETERKLALEASYKMHALALKIKANSIDLSATNAVRWIKTNFFHAYNEWGWDIYGTSEWESPADLESLFKERIVGCHLPVMLLSEILRSLNIPAVNLAVNAKIAGHGVTYIPTLKRYVHGDHLAYRPLVPVKYMLLTEDEIVQWNQINPNTDPPSIDWDLTYLLDNKIKAVFDPNLSWLFTCGIHREGTKLNLEIQYNWNLPVPADIIDAFKTEAQQYNIQYDVATMKFTSQPVPIQSLESLSQP
jgi:hypothetical protein